MSRAAYMREWRRKRAEQIGGRILHGRITTAPRRVREVPDHGHPNRYAHDGCRCDVCRDGWNAYNRQTARRRRSGG